MGESYLKQLNATAKIISFRFDNIHVVEFTEDCMKLNVNNWAVYLIRSIFSEDLEEFNWKLEKSKQNNRIFILLL